MFSLIILYSPAYSSYEFTDPAAPVELAWSDLETREGKADSWSAYWYNGAMYVNGGLNRRNDAAPAAPSGNRGFEAYELELDDEVVETSRWRYMNPQTQEEFQAP